MRPSPVELVDLLEPYKFAHVSKTEELNVIVNARPGCLETFQRVDTCGRGSERGGRGEKRTGIADLL